MARFEVWPLRFLPHEQSGRRGDWESSFPQPADRRACGGMWRGKLHVVGAHRAGRSSRRNVQANEYGVAMGVSDRGPVVVGGIRVVAARHNHAIAVPLELGAHRLRHLQHDVLLRDRFAARSGIRAAVRWIENDDGSDGRGSLRRCRSGRGHRRLLLRRGCCLRLRAGRENGRRRHQTQQKKRIPHGAKDIRNIAAFGGQSHTAAPICARAAQSGA